MLGGRCSAEISEEEVGGLSVFEIIHPDDGSCFHELFERGTFGREPHQCEEAMFKTKQGDACFGRG